MIEVRMTRRFTDPLVEPIDASELAADLNIIDDDVMLVGRKIAAARTHIENFLGRALITQTREFTTSWFPPGALRLPVPPFQEVTSIEYHDPAGGVQTLDTYTVSQAGDYGHVWADGGWPATGDQPGAVRILFTCGYGDTGEDVPADIREAIRQLAGHFYEHREAVFVGSGGAFVLPYGVEAMLTNYREWAF